MISAVLGLGLAACSTAADVTGSMFKSAQSVQVGVVDAGEAAALISKYRQSKGLPAVTIDPTLMKIATDHSRAMARAGKMAHVLPGQGSFQQKLASGGFRPTTAAENVAAGQKTLEGVLEAWRKSPGHNANLLLPGATKIGIAVATNPDNKYKTFWTLEIGEWYTGPEGGMGGPNAGPLVLPTETGATLTIGGSS